MLDAKTVLDVMEDALEKDPQAFKSRLGSQWIEFSRRVGDLAGQFKAVAGEDTPEAAVSNLELAVNDLLEVCWDYPYVAELLDQAERTSLEPGLGSGGMMIPPSSKKEPQFNPREIANRYYDLFAKLKETTDQVKEDANDR
jgi:hypothetical protein